MRIKKIFVSDHFKSLFFTISIVLVCISGSFHLWYLNTLVVPDRLYCDYYDDYHNKLYSSISGCPEMKNVKTEYKNNELTYLSYQLNETLFKRYYENQKIKKTIEVSEQGESFTLQNQRIPLLIDQKIIETNYFYEKESFKQTRTITYYANEQAFLVQRGSYEAVIDYEDIEFSNVIYNIKIMKNLSTYEFILTDSQLVSQVFTGEYLEELDNSPSNYVLKIKKYYQAINEENYRNLFWVSKNSTEYSVEGDYKKDDGDNEYVTYTYADPSINAWHEFDSRFTLSYYEFNIGYKSEVANYRYGTNCNKGNGDITYCDTVENNDLEYRHLVTSKNHITIVETYNMINKIFGDNDDIFLKNKVVNYKDLPFNDYICQTELFDSPKPHLKFAEE